MSNPKINTPDAELVQAWTERLRLVLIEKAVLQFKSRRISVEEFSEFLTNTTFIPDWDNNFIIRSYDEYLRKITEAGEGLTENVSG
jgi:hypothetical protein